MRSSLLLAALAVGAANAFEKRVYVTDWTTVTVTKTVTASAVTETIPATEVVVKTSTAPAVTEAVPASKQSQVVYQTSTAPVVSETTPATTHSQVEKTSTPAPVETQTQLTKKTTTVESSTVHPPTTSQAPETQPQPQTSSVQTSSVSTPSQAPEAQPQPQTSSLSTSWYSTVWTSTVQAASSTLATTTSAASTPSSTPINAYQQDVLYNHNIHRSNHSSPSLEWASDLESSALALASTCVYKHDTSIDGGGYGQNIGYGVKDNQIGMLITDLMYNDEFGFFPTPFGQPSPSMELFEQWGHFTQIIWKDTTHVGCATVMCNGLANIDSSMPLPFTVCNYSPPGNYDGEYADNVLAPLGHPLYSVV